MKKYLFVLRKSPHCGTQTQEMLDIILTTAAFDQPVSILLLDDGVFLLKKSQDTKASGLKDTLAIFNALEIVDVTDIVCEAESLQERGIKSDGLSLPIREVSRKELAALMKQFDIVVAG